MSNEENLKLLGVNFKDKKNNAIEFLNKLGDPYDDLTKDEFGKHSINFGIYGIPESILIDKDLIIIKKFIGPISKNDYNYIKKNDQIKFVICDKADYDWSVDYIKKYRLSEKCKILFSPSYDEMSPTELADLILSDELKVRLQIQLHKVLWGNERGK